MILRYVLEISVYNLNEDRLYLSKSLRTELDEDLTIRYTTKNNSKTIIFGN